MSPSKLNGRKAFPLRRFHQPMIRPRNARFLGFSLHQTGAAAS